MSNRSKALLAYSSIQSKTITTRGLQQGRSGGVCVSTLRDVSNTRAPSINSLKKRKNRNHERLVKFRQFILALAKARSLFDVWKRV